MTLPPNESVQSQVSSRLALLRKLMESRGLDVILVFSTDEHLNEYLHPRRQRREAISGFTGSAGDVAIRPDQAHLFVDSRYHLQAEQETSPQDFTLHKIGIEGQLELSPWLSQLEKETGPLKVGIDPFQISPRTHDRLKQALKNEASSLIPLAENPVDGVWPERPPARPGPAYPLPLEITGESVTDKLGRLRERLKEEEAEALVLNGLDEVAWLTNLRGSDIPYNPVFEAYMLIDQKQALCYSDAPLDETARSGLEGLVEFRPYRQFRPELKSYAEKLAQGGGTIWLDQNSATQGLVNLAGEARINKKSPNPVVKMKAVKNRVELGKMVEGHIKAGCAKVRAFSNLFAELAQGEHISEAEFAGMLEGEYAREEGYRELSFATISAFGENAASVHYGTPDPKEFLEPGGLLLVDSGVQIIGATTDDTRTVAIGEPSQEQRTRYTAVLRAHIHLAMQIFPEGTTGIMLDAITRSSLWNEGLDYGHGTGHGVGAFLNVHEGPQNISQRGKTPLEAGMVVSNEPGYYLPGWGGIRLENLYTVEEAPEIQSHPAGKKWLRFSPLTLIPFDGNLIESSLMTGEESAWLERYHRKVIDTLGPLLEPRHRNWLEKSCRVAEKARNNQG